MAVYDKLIVIEFIPPCEDGEVCLANCGNGCICGDKPVNDFEKELINQNN